VSTGVTSAAGESPVPPRPWEAAIVDLDRLFTTDGLAPGMQDAVRFLADSPDRLALLSRLREGAAGPATLAGDLDCARRSVQRNLVALTERGWVERGDAGYRLTAAGDVAADIHAAYRERLERLERFAPLFRHLEPEAAPPLAALDGAGFAVTSPETPQAPVQFYVDRVESLGGDTVRMCSPVLSRRFHDAHAALAMQGVHTELVLPAAAAETARERNPVEFETVVGVGVLDLYVHPGSLPFVVTVGADGLLLAAHDEDGRLQACLAADDPAVVEWGTATFERYREAARPVAAPADAPTDPDSS
jgi:predicted transcriptional regulator